MPPATTTKGCEPRGSCGTTILKAKAPVGSVAGAGVGRTGMPPTTTEVTGAKPGNPKPDTKMVELGDALAGSLVFGAALRNAAPRLEGAEAIPFAVQPFSSRERRRAAGEGQHTDDRNQSSHSAARLSGRVFSEGSVSHSTTE